MLIDAIDSYYIYISQQMAIVAPSQKLCGFISARDWPLTPPDTTGGLYLLYLRSIQLPKGTESQNLFQYFMQWVWIVIGTDIQANQQAENRGDRFRSSMNVESNLRQAHYPGFTQKKAFSVATQGALSSTGVQSVYPPSSIEMVTWTRPKFMPRQDNAKSGLIYGAAAVELFAYDDIATALVA